MVRYYRLSPAIWLEPWDDDMRLVAFYLLTCPHRTTEGLFRMPLEYARTDMGWSVKRFDKAFGLLIAADFVDYDEEAQVVLIVNALKYQSPANDNQALGAVRALAQLPPNRLANRFETVAKAKSERLTKALVQAFPEGFGEQVGTTQAQPQALASTSSNGGQQ
jgi:hypothetical protein